MAEYVAIKGSWLGRGLVFHASGKLDPVWRDADGKVIRQRDRDARSRVAVVRSRANCGAALYESGPSGMRISSIYGNREIIELIARPCRKCFPNG